jgi:hypothetical protein
MFSPDELIFIAPERSAVELATGSFVRRIWVLALAEPNPVNSNKIFLAKVLVAANLNLEKDTLFAEIPASMPIGFSTDLKTKHPERVLVFGLPPAQLGLTIEAQLYKPLAFYGADWLFADALSILEPDKNKKGQLWSALKQMFL